MQQAGLFLGACRATPSVAFGHAPLCRQVGNPWPFAVELTAIRSPIPDRSESEGALALGPLCS